MMHHINFNFPGNKKQGNKETGNKKPIPQVFVAENKSLTQMPPTVAENKSLTQVPPTVAENKSLTQVPPTPQKEDFWDSSFEVIQPFLSQQTCSKCKTSQLRAMLPKVSPNVSDIFGVNVTCAVVTGSPTLRRYKYGQLIDSFPVVMRFNLHGTYPPSSYGSKTTHRLINKKVNRKNITFVSNLSEMVISKHLGSPKEILRFYLARKQNFNRGYMLISTFLKTVSIAAGTHHHHPTTGLMGLFLLSKVCTSIHTFGFVKTTDEHTDPKHDYGVKHKLLQKWSQDPDAQVKLFLYPSLR